MFQALLLHAKIAAACPIVGVSVGDPANAATWSFVHTAAATPAQIAAATKALAAITPAALAAANNAVSAARAAIPDPLTTAKAAAVTGLPSPAAGA